MSIDDASKQDWDAAAKYVKDTPDFRQEDLGCTLIRDFPERDGPNFDWDVVDRPKHYTTSEIECIDYIHMQLGSGVRDYLRGQIYKYAPTPAKGCGG